MRRRTGIRLVAIAVLMIGGGCGPQHVPLDSEPEEDEPDVDESSTGGSSGGSTSASGETDAASEAVCQAQESWYAGLNEWQHTTESRRETYSYQVETSGNLDFSAWFHACFYRTTIAVTAGVPVQRTFELIRTSQGATPDDCEPGFMEVGAEVGGHDVADAFEPLVMDELYAKCCSEVLVGAMPLEDYELDVSFGPDGELSACRSVDLGSADERPHGFALATFAFGP